MKSGLASVTFRGMTPDEIVAMVAAAGLDGIEWAGDVHVLPGYIDHARHVRKVTEDAGLALPSYGSYYRAGDPATPRESFQRVLDTAVVLGVKTIRVWPGMQGSEVATDDYRKSVTEDLRRVGLLAREAGIAVGCEYHGGTLTDTTESALQLAREVEDANVRLYWQPPRRRPFACSHAELQAITPFLCNVHVFSWEFTETGIIRRPLAEEATAWREYLGIISSSAPESWAFLEFVKDDSPEQFREDAATLRSWIRE